MEMLDLINEGKITRYFANRKKFSFPGTVCHIIQRAPGKETLFIEESDYLYMLFLLKTISKRFNFEIFSFALMPNHIHLLIRILEPNLPMAMKSLFGNYAMYFNKKYERKGHVFCSTYRQALCFDDSYYLAISLYIHLNAVNAGLAVHPEEYRWSSCNLFVNPSAKAAFIKCNLILKILDGDLNIARQKYKILLFKMRKVKAREIIRNYIPMELFRNKLIKVLPYRFISIAKDKDKFELLDDENLEKQIKLLRARGRLRNPQDLKAREYLIQQLKAQGYAIVEISKRLGISRRSVYNTLEYKSKYN
jgi:putative transposase